MPVILMRVCSHHGELVSHLSRFRTMFAKKGTRYLGCNWAKGTANFRRCVWFRIPHIDRAGTALQKDEDHRLGLRCSHGTQRLVGQQARQTQAAEQPAAQKPAAVESATQEPRTADLQGMTSCHPFAVSCRRTLAAKFDSQHVRPHLLARNGLRNRLNFLSSQSDLPLAHARR